MSPFIPFDVPAILHALNTAEGSATDHWGGGNTLGGSPRVTPRHSRTSSIEALANAASFVQPYKATIVYGAQPLPQHFS